MTFGRRFVAAVVTVPLLVVGGCADDPEPKLAPPSETPTSASPSPTASPEPWEKKTNAGAVAFAKHWIDVFSDAMVSGDTGEIKAVSARECESCTSVIQRIDSVYGAGGSYRTDGWMVLQADAVSDGSNSSVAMNVRRTAEVFRESGGAPAERNPASRASFSAQLRWVDGAWTMLKLDLAA